MREYKDIDGNPTTLSSLVRSEPAWAAQRIATLEAQLAELRGKVRGWADRAEKFGAITLSNEMRQAAQEDGNG